MIRERARSFYNKLTGLPAGLRSAPLEEEGPLLGDPETEHLARRRALWVLATLIGADPAVALLWVQREEERGRDEADAILWYARTAVDDSGRPCCFRQYASQKAPSVCDLPMGHAGQHDAPLAVPFLTWVEGAPRELYRFHERGLELSVYDAARLNINPHRWRA